jgi:hypothetical protein
MVFTSLGLKENALKVIGRLTECLLVGSKCSCHFSFKAIAIIGYLLTR